uniref:Uncharacterized protein n=1 Tax=Anguilla anguilla TaxID=7936 RepID=A0A0E9UU82_ANGAN
MLMEPSQILPAHFLGANSTPHSQHYLVIQSGLRS